MKTIILAMILPFMLISSKDPIHFMIIILIQTTLVALISSMLTKISWFSYILFLIMVGGLLLFNRLPKSGSLSIRGVYFFRFFFVCMLPDFFSCGAPFWMNMVLFNMVYIRIGETSNFGK